MATRKGVGGSNDPVKLVDEYQIQVPNKYLQKWEFDTISEAESFLAQQKEEYQGKRVFDGHKFKKVIEDENGKPVLDADGNKQYKPILNDNGKIELRYCPVGEMVVKCVERASRMMELPVLITGEYLTGQNWAECH